MWLDLLLNYFCNHLPGYKILGLSIYWRFEKAWFSESLKVGIVCLRVNPLLHTHFDTSTLDSFWNPVGKREIAHNELFLFFPKCFQLNHIVVSLFFYIFDIISLFAAELKAPKSGIWGKGFLHPWKKSQLPFTRQSQLLNMMKKTFETIVGKGVNADNQLFSFSHDVFLPCQSEVSSFWSPLIWCLQMVSYSPTKIRHGEFIQCFWPAFSPYPTMFSTGIIIYNLKYIFLLSANVLNLVGPKYLSAGKN